MQQATIPSQHVSFFAGLLAPTVIKDAAGRELGLFLPPDYPLPAGRSFDELHRSLLNARGQCVEDVWNAFIAVQQ